MQLLRYVLEKVCSNQGEEDVGQSCKDSKQSSKYVRRDKSCVEVYEWDFHKYLMFFKY